MIVFAPRFSRGEESRADPGRRGRVSSRSSSLGWVLTRANPLTVWTWNLKNHARFYVEYPRTYLAWLVVNPIELAVALGLPAVVWCLVGLAGPRSVPRVAWATLAVLVLLNLIGRNMGEVARLWMLFLPPLLTAAGAGFSSAGGRDPGRWESRPPCWACRPWPSRR